jgi:serine protease AprX
VKRFATLTALLLSLSATLFAGTEKISPDLLPYLNSSGQVQVVVQYAPGSETSCNSLLGVVDCLLNSVLSAGGKLLSDIPIVNNVVALVDGTGLLNLSNQANVVYISKDRPLSTLLSNAAPAINAQAAWNAGYTGSGIGIALVDSGVNNHKDLTSVGLLGLTTSRIVYNQSFVAGTTSAADQYGHGTHIAGLIAGNGAGSTGSSYTKTFKGIAPGAKIVNLRVLDQNGAGTDSMLITAIMQAIALKSEYNIRVINLSLGRPVYESYQLDPVCRAVELAWKKGIVVVVAAGNNGRYQGTNGYGTITSPGNDPYVITVGAMKPMGTPDRADDLIASYSSKGPASACPVFFRLVTSGVASRPPWRGYCKLATSDEALVAETVLPHHSRERYTEFTFLSETSEPPCG